MGLPVGELARRTGVGVSTLRAWERRFQFLVPERSRFDRDRLVGSGGTAAAHRHQDALEYEVAEIEHAHGDVDGDQRGDRTEREAGKQSRDEAIAGDDLAGREHLPRRQHRIVFG